MQNQLAIAAAVAAVLLSAALEARADDDVAGAAKAFTQAQQAMLEGKSADAAELYELADELAPSAAALRNAARARIAAGHIAMAATNAAELLRRYPDDKASRSIAEEILVQVGPKVARIDVACAGGCTVLLDGRAASKNTSSAHGLFAKPGDHEITAVFGEGRKAAKKMSVQAGTRSSITIEAPPVEPVRPAAGLDVEPRDRAAEPAVVRRGGSEGISKWWFAGGTVLTLGLGAAATFEGLATLDDRDRVRMLDAAGDPSAAAEYEKARDRQTLTNVLIGATAAAGVATIAMAFFTNWSGEDGGHTEHVTIAPSTTGLSVVYGTRF